MKIHYNLKYIKVEVAIAMNYLSNRAGIFSLTSSIVGQKSKITEGFNMKRGFSRLNRSSPQPVIFNMITASFSTLFSFTAFINVAVAMAEAG